MILYMLLINAAGLLIMLWDKRLAVKKRWRVPEMTLFLVALLGGAVGEIFGMYLFSHKTLHKEFTIGLPLILFLQVALYVTLQPA
ncbi:MAG: DUF1294 domain-containing protein [Oscillospiraceae bacterium]|nr:DUF1294 domain-containing protein [Oscillospiraceae bacterium]